MSPVIDAEAYLADCRETRSCSPVIDADARQIQLNKIRPRVCEEVIVA